MEKEGITVGWRSWGRLCGGGETSWALESGITCTERLGEDTDMNNTWKL